MKEKIYDLPSIFFKDKYPETSIHFYKTDLSSKNNKVNFTENLICFLQEGTKTIIGNNLNERIDNKNLFILQASSVLMTETVTKQNNYKSILLFFSDKYFMNLLHKNNIPPKELVNKTKSIKVTKDDYLLNFEQSLEILKNKLCNDDSFMKLKIDEVILYLLKNHFNVFYPIMQNILGRAKNYSFLEVIQNNLDKNLTIEELAFLCNVSISTFKRKFTKIFNTTPKKYFIKSRMEKAVVLLKNNKRPSEIYYGLGYENLSSFSSEFKKYYGASPTIYGK